MRVCALCGTEGKARRKVRFRLDLTPQDLEINERCVVYVMLCTCLYIPISCEDGKNKVYGVETREDTCVAISRSKQVVITETNVERRV